MSPYHYLIIGNGAAGISAAEVIRKRDRQGRITVVTSEPCLFYSRPGIAYYILGQVTDQQLISRRESFYRDHRLNLQFGRVQEIDPAAQLVYFDDGRPLSYDVLLLATGASAVRPDFPGSELEGVLTFDTLDDAKRVIRHSRRARAAVVVGGGITAMELAEGITRNGAKTHLLQRRDRIWPRLFGRRESAIVEHYVRHEGIELRYGEEITEITGKRGKVAGVRLKSGSFIKCQVVGVAIGVQPNLELVRRLPLRQDRGVVVNEYMQSSIPNLFAAGDVAQVYDRWTQRHNLDILWPSAINEGRAAGYNMVDVARGIPPTYRYQKGSPFNAALLFGVHLTVIGRVGLRSNEECEELSHLSRGSSHVWTFPFTTNHRSAWDHKGPNSLRVVMSNGRLVGALVMGDQGLSDPLRRMIEEEADLSGFESLLLDRTRALPESIMKAWRDWHQSWQ